MASDGKQTAGDHPAIRFPPPLVFLGFVLAGPLIERFVMIPPLVGWWPLGAVLIAAGALLIVLAGGLFRKTGETAKPWTPTKTIIDTGIYGITRNPMYLAMTMIAIGLAVLLHSWLALLLVPVAVAVTHELVIEREEEYLSATFGERYRDYMRRVPRWL